MLVKSRTESEELLILKSLDARMILKDKDKQYFLSLQKGYDGELVFDSYTSSLTCDCYILNDLLLNLNNTTFQIDSLLIFPQCMHIYEVKNFEGDYFYESDRFHLNNKTEISNPLHQISRSESLLRQLLQSLGISLPVESTVAFVHPEFHLYQAPVKVPFIYPTQVPRHIRKLNTIPGTLSKKHQHIADKLISLHQTESSFSNVPAYTFEELRKGIRCLQCGGFGVAAVGRYCVCNECGFGEPAIAAIKRSVDEFKLLFPDHPITTNAIYNWCKIIHSKERIRYTLQKNFKMTGVRQWSVYK